MNPGTRSCGQLTTKIAEICQRGHVKGDDRETFRVPDARRAGVPRRWIDGDGFDRPFHGLRAPRRPAPDEDGFAQQRADVLRAIGHWTVHMHDAEYFSHVTAAVIWELPIPAWAAQITDLHISSPVRAIRARGAIGHQIKAVLATVVVHPTLGVRVTDPATTWTMLAGMFSHLYDVVAIGDAIIRTPRIPGPNGRIERAALASLAQLESAARAGRRRGAELLREALPLIRPGSASRTESWTRLTIVEAGLPEPVLNYDVYDEAGRFVGCIDLGYPDLRIAIEFEGDQHRTDPAQWQRDIEKYEQLADLGWRVVRVTRDQLFNEPSVFIARVRRLLFQAH